MPKGHQDTAGIVGAWARGAHFWHEYREVHGFPVATQMRVLAPLGRQPVPLLTLEPRLDVAGID